MQKQSVAWSGSTSLLEFHLSQLAGDIEIIKLEDKKFLKVFKEITVKIDRKMIVLEVMYLVKQVSLIGELVAQFNPFWQCNGNILPVYNI